MQSKQLAGAKPTESTQKYLDIAEITDDVVVLKDGSLRAVLLTSSVNFALKSADEQNATIAAYVGFLNSFEFPIQIVIQSRKMNIDPYIEKLKTMEKEQTNELLKMQTAEYRMYVTELIELGEIMSKRFYVVVPFHPLIGKQKNFFQRLSEALSPAKSVSLKRKWFLERRRELMQRVDLVESGLSSMGLNTVLLTTQNLIELYYNCYNPETSQQQKMTDVSKITVEEK